ncbi:uncharacterized protein DUF4124 [Marinimicrobium koreense]|uniref:Uncharacterized protein DUF4124 n=1 Tax=Marinimicrobium koreense TaxID=306545 RepID=A0A3N1NW14_9GAMM|nr:DUF4124 domain-containing protein [Marinimicrobium koreense]ROQ18610.1 uncharacterized protein DUF4124 [Marinimicrobium koreense]
MRSALLLITLMLFSLLTVAQPIYKTVDEEGRVSYSDKPPRGVQEDASDELPPVNNVPGQPVSPQRRATAEEEAPDPVDYSIEIVSPQPDSSVPPGQRDLPISVRLQPALQPGHALVYYLDGDPVAETRSTQHIVREIYRGTHTVRVEILNPQGQSLAATAPITIHVHRPSVIPRGGS